MRISDWSSDVCSSDLGLPARALRLLADADACRSLGKDRRTALWEKRRTPSDELPLFAAAKARELGEEPDGMLHDMALSEHVEEIGSASDGERVGTNVKISVVGGELNKKTVQTERF